MSRIQDGKRVRLRVSGRTKSEIMGRLKPQPPARWLTPRLISRSADVPVEEIARPTGHSDIRTTETVYQHELRPVIRTGAGVIYRLLGEAKGAIGTLAV